MGLVPSADTSVLSGATIESPIGDFTNYAWYNNFVYLTGGTIAGVYSYLFVYEVGMSTTGFRVTQYNYPAKVNNYNNIMVAALRSRGSYTGKSTLTLAATGVTMASSSIESNPLGDFTLTVTCPTNGGTKVFTCSLDQTSTHYISKVLGVDVYDKSSDDYPLYAYELYPNLIYALNERGLIRGLSTTVLTHSVDNDFLTQWDTPASPMIVSEVRGGKVC